MAITLTVGEQQHGSTWQTSETFTESTATAQRQLSADVDVSFIGMGTATAGHVHNLYKLTSTTTASGVEGDAVEGMIKMIMATATGRADVFVEQSSVRLPVGAGSMINATATTLDATFASATGSYVFQSADDYCLFRFMNGAWRWIDGIGATQATAT